MISYAARQAARMALSNLSGAGNELLGVPLACGLRRSRGPAFRKRRKVEVPPWRLPGGKPCGGGAGRSTLARAGAPAAAPRGGAITLSTLGAPPGQAGLHLKPLLQWRSDDDPAQ